MTCTCGHEHRRRPRGTKPKVPTGLDWRSIPALIPALVARRPDLGDMALAGVRFAAAVRENA